MEPQDSKQHMKLILQAQEASQPAIAGNQARAQLPLELRFHNPISHLNPDLRPFRMACHAKSHRVFDEGALKAEGGATMFRLLAPQTMNLDSSKLNLEMNQDQVWLHGKIKPVSTFLPICILTTWLL